MKCALVSRQRWNAPKTLANVWKKRRSRESRPQTRSSASIRTKASASRLALASSSACSSRASNMTETNNGLFASAKRLVDLTLATAQNRVELFAVELQEEKC